MKMNDTLKKYITCVALGALLVGCKAPTLS